MMISRTLKRSSSGGACAPACALAQNCKESIHTTHASADAPPEPDVEERFTMSAVIMPRHPPATVFHQPVGL